MSRTGRTGATRISFGVYALIIVTLTHWPGLQVPDTGLSRSDLIVHMGVFGTWAFLMIRCAWFGPVFSARNILIAGLVSLAYAGVDEGTQAFPILRRFAGWDDFSANMLGIAAGVSATLIQAALDPPALGHR